MQGLCTATKGTLLLPLLVVDLPASALIGGGGVGGGGGGECVCHETVTIKHHPAWTWNGRAGV